MFEPAQFLCRAFSARCRDHQNPALTRGATTVPPLRGWSPSHWRGLSFDCVSEEKKREAPAEDSHARKSVVEDARQNRGMKGRHIGIEQFIRRSSVMRTSKSDISETAVSVWLAEAGKRALLQRASCYR